MVEVNNGAIDSHEAPSENVKSRLDGSIPKPQNHP